MDEILIMPRFSRYAGEPVDTSSRRSIIVVESNGEALGFGAAEATIDYFYHDDTYWRAVIPLHRIVTVYGQAFNFSRPRTRRTAEGTEILFDRRGLPKRTVPFLYHVQSRFVLEPSVPARLYPLGSKPTGRPAHEICDLVYSVEAVGPPGVRFGLGDGLRGHLLSSHRILSTEQMVFERIVVQNQYVTESPPLPLSDIDKHELLVASLVRGGRAGMDEPYYLFRCIGTNNCTSNPFRILDQVVDYTIPQRIGSMLYRLPINPRFYLWMRGLDSEPGTLKLVRDEFQEFIADKDTQRRKRVVVRAEIQRRRAANQ